MVCLRKKGIFLATKKPDTNSILPFLYKIGLFCCQKLYNNNKHVFIVQVILLPTKDDFNCFVLLPKTPTFLNSFEHCVHNCNQPYDEMHQGH